MTAEDSHIPAWWFKWRECPPPANHEMMCGLVDAFVRVAAVNEASCTECRARVEKHRHARDQAPQEAAE